MWASGRYDLGLTEAEFWAITLKELNALSERHQSNQNWLDYRAALVCAVFANTGRNPKKKIKPFVPEDFMPNKGKAKRQTAEQMFAAVQLLNAAFGGKISEN